MKRIMRWIRIAPKNGTDTSDLESLLQALRTTSVQLRRTACPAGDMNHPEARAAAAAADRQAQRTRLY